ncbi:hypothetical protein T03_4287 [Trichinella britovi]|uniref:Uncharacterized protein n=1 Tax=Trichinella britovi TaxID=45882 RepID=A0A0V1AN68_TRIBR|nr:hypothetical protein T03_4287 [Trichinella britovi]
MKKYLNRVLFWLILDIINIFYSITKLPSTHGADGK